MVAQPVGPTSPELWILGSSSYGAQVAAFFGLPYCYAYFFTEGQGAMEALEIYRATYRPSEAHPLPYSAIAVFALAADTQADAEWLFAPREMWRAERERGRFVPLPSPEEAAAYPFTASEIARNAVTRERSAYGTPDVVRGRLEAVGRSHGVDEIAVVTALHDPVARRRSFTLLAEAFGLGERVRLAAE